VYFEVGVRTGHCFFLLWLLLVVVLPMSLEDVDLMVFVVFFFPLTASGEVFRLMMVVLEEFGVELFVFVGWLVLFDGADGMFLFMDFPDGLVPNMSGVKLSVVGFLLVVWLCEDTAIMKVVFLLVVLRQVSHLRSLVYLMLLLFLVVVGRLSDVVSYWRAMLLLPLLSRSIIL
jgi:hypothetical protein